MTQYPQYLRYLEEAKREEVADNLRSKGFVVETEKQVGDVRFDLFAHKGNQGLVYEFKSAGSKRLSRDALLRLQNSAKNSGYEFHMVIVNPPPRVNIEIPKLRKELLDYMINENFPNELNSLSSNTLIDNVVDVEISDIRLDDSGLHVEGTGPVDFTLQYGGSADSTSSSDAYPFEFSAALNPDATLASVERLDVDTSSFYEQ